MPVRSLRLFSGFILLFIVLVLAQSASAQTIVLYASQAPVKVGSKWSVVADSTAAGSFRLANADQGASKVVTPLAAPGNYVEMSFYANAGQPYHLWMRGKAAGDSPYNDSVHVQFSGSVTSSGSPIYRIGTSSSTEYNLEDCLGCAVSGWGWQDNGWGTLGSDIYFQSSGLQTIRIQEREDGLSLDQIILSPSTYLSSSPGSMKNDGVILTAFSGTPTSTPTPTPTPTPIPTPTPTPAPPPPSSASEVVIWASNVPSTSLRGSWIRESSASAAGQVALRNPDAGAGKITTALVSPTNYVDISFNAVAGTAYRLWLRGRAEGNYWGNDSVFVQFSGSMTAPTGSAAYRIGTSSAMEVNLEDCSGCGVSGWGWQDNGWGVGVLGPLVYFQTSGNQTLRIQTREDGFSFDQIVLSPSRYLLSAPGALMNDGVILAYTEGAPAPAPTPVPTPTPNPTPTPVQNQPPQLSISASPSSGGSPLLVSFFSTASDPDGFIASYFWNFGDTSSSTAASPQHWYATGTYVASLTVTDNSGASTTRSVTISVGAAAPPPPSATSQVKVLSWNVSFGQGTDGQTNWNRIATYIANFNPDLAALCEMPPADIGNLVSLLGQKTGQTWYWHFVAKWPGYEYEGNLILSKYSFSSTNARYMSYERSVAQATVNIGGKNVNFFATHLDHTSSSLRYQQVTELQNFMAGFSETKIVGGDFNAGPDLSEAIHMAEQTYDSWVNAMNIGTATAYADNPVYLHTRTRRGRIDYIWISKNSNAVVKSAQIPDVRDLNNKNVVVSLGTADDWGVRPSDHNAMIAIIELR